MGHRLKFRKISSISGVITNSSTQIFEINITDKFLKLIQEKDIAEDFVIINGKEDIIRILKAGDEAKSVYDVLELQILIEELKYQYYDVYGLFIDGDFGDLWIKLRKTKSVEEIVNFFESVIFKNLYGMIFYSYSDEDYNQTAKILYNNGYTSRRID